VAKKLPQWAKQSQGENVRTFLIAIGDAYDIFKILE
jgi:hypothetical protein